MKNRQGNSPSSLWRELQIIARRGRKVWRLVPHRYKLALGGAALLMALVSACNTAIPLFLGQLVDPSVDGDLYPRPNAWNEF